jgi:hypothetical protein
MRETKRERGSKEKIEYRDKEGQMDNKRNRLRDREREKPIH